MTLDDFLLAFFSLDILRQKVPNPTFKSALDDVYERWDGLGIPDADRVVTVTATGDRALHAAALLALPFSLFGIEATSGMVVTACLSLAALTVYKLAD